MNKQFEKHIESLVPSFAALLAMQPVMVDKLPKVMPTKGIYLFSSKLAHSVEECFLYVGRTNNIRTRVQIHCRPSSGHNSATFAFRMTRSSTGNTKASYSAKGSRQHLLEDENFKTTFDQKKKAIRYMNLRFVAEDDPVRQALLEMYVALSLNTPHNDFENH